MDSVLDKDNGEMLIQKVNGGFAWHYWKVENHNLGRGGNGMNKNEEVMMPWNFNTRVVASATVHVYIQFTSTPVSTKHVEHESRATVKT